MTMLEFCTQNELHSNCSCLKEKNTFSGVSITRLSDVHSLVYPQLKLGEATSRSFLPAAGVLLPPQQPCVVLSPAIGEHHDGEHAHTYPSYTGHSSGL